MQVTITYIDNKSFTKEEVVRNALHIHGKTADVKIMPESSNAHDLIYFGIQQMITHEQLSLIYDSNGTYQKDLQKLRAEVLYKLQEIVDTVIVDNETKVAN
jgi:hypothetical protein